MEYEDLLLECDQNGLVVKEKPLSSSDGRIQDKTIAIRKNLPLVKKACVLAEELGHYYTASGDVLDQTTVSGIKKERIGRIHAYNRMVGPAGIVAAYEHRCMTLVDMADFLSVTEEFLLEALECYRQKYGTCRQYKNYIIMFEPSLAVVELLP